MIVNIQSSVDDLKIFIILSILLKLSNAGKWIGAKHYYSNFFLHKYVNNYVL